MDPQARVTPAPVYGLVDMNSFYCSCEQAFRPDLQGKAVVVASNNDGNVVSRNAAAKVLGVPMGEPVFRLRPLIEAGKLTLFSSNYESYADYSARAMAAVASLVPRATEYSIDECFVTLTGMTDLTALGTAIRARVLRWTQIPCCVGIGPTLTLAKYCNHLAKQHTAFQGVCNWLEMDEAQRCAWLASQPVQEVWGIGSRIAAKLATMGIDTALQLRDADPRRLRAVFGVVVERTARELAGWPCLQLDDVDPPRQQLVRSRSFGRPVTRIEDLQAAIAHHVASAAEALRRQRSVAGMLAVEIRTNPFRETAPQYHGYDCLGLPAPTADTLALTQAAMTLLRRVYRRGFVFKKAGILISGIEPGAMPRQRDWLSPGDAPERLALLDTMDRINARWGRGTIQVAAAELGEAWRMRRDQLSPCYTTRWDALPIAR